MSLPSSHLLPSSAFRHIGVMVAFMGLIACLCITGFISVKDITAGWIIDIDNSLMIEIPPYDAVNRILSESEIEGIISGIQTITRNDPIIVSTRVDRADGGAFEFDDRFNIPATAFITLKLIEGRVNNAEDRIINLIQENFPITEIIRADDEIRQIQKTALALQLVFGGLTLSIFAVTAFVLSVVVKTQISANRETIELIHLMGAQRNTIAHLFKNAVTKPVIIGIFISLILSALLIIPALPLLRLELDMTQFIVTGSMIAVSFIILCRLVTHISVVLTLRGMP
jgi:cell division transport system permease protein